MRQVTIALALLAGIAPSANSAAADEGRYGAIVAKPDKGEQIAFSRMADGQLVAYDVVAAYEQHRSALADCAAYHVRFKDVVWCFASDDNRALFEDAAKDERTTYLPAFGGRCTLGLSYGDLGAEGDPRTAIRIGETLVLNGSFEARHTFLEDTERYMDNAAAAMRLGRRLGDVAPNAELPISMPK